eukprot:Platyproteum_vivax@DN84_c0_g1_i1.p1
MHTTPAITWNWQKKLGERIGVDTWRLHNLCEGIFTGLEEPLESGLGRGLSPVEFGEKLCTNHHENSPALCLGEELWIKGQEPWTKESASDKNLKEAKSYMDGKKEADGIKEIADGILHEVLDSGKGTTYPTPTDTVKVHYRPRNPIGDRSKCSDTWVD